MGLVRVEINAGFSTQGAARSASVGANTRLAELCARTFFCALTAVVAIGFERHALSVAHAAISAVKDALAVFAKITSGTSKAALSAIFGIFIKLGAGVVAKSGFGGATDAATASTADANFAKVTSFSALTTMIGIFFHVGATQSAQMRAVDGAGKHLAEVFDAISACDAVFLFAARPLASTGSKARSEKQQQEQKARKIGEKEKSRSRQTGRSSRHDAPTALKDTFAQAPISRE